MTLLEKLEICVREGHSMEDAKVTHFAIADDGTIAYLTELELDELVFELEKWCKQIHLEMGSVH